MLKSLFLLSGIISENLLKTEQVKFLIFSISEQRIDYLPVPLFLGKQINRRDNKMATKQILNALRAIETRIEKAIGGCKVNAYMIWSGKDAGQIGVEILKG